MEEALRAKLEELSRLGTATVYEAGLARGFTAAMDPAIRLLTPGGARRLFGPAFTAEAPAQDNLTLHHAIAEAAAGDVIVAATGGVLEGMWGEIMTVAAMARGLAGLVADGAVRDIEAIEARGFPVFARGTFIRGTRKERLGVLNQPVLCGGVMVRPGDYVIGDADGVVVLAREGLDEVLAAARRRAEKEAETMRQLAQGVSTRDLFPDRFRVDPATGRLLP